MLTDYGFPYSEEYIESMESVEVDQLIREYNILCNENIYGLESENKKDNLFKRIWKWIAHKWEIFMDFITGRKKSETVDNVVKTAEKQVQESTSKIDSIKEGNPTPIPVIQSIPTPSPQLNNSVEKKNINQPINKSNNQPINRQNPQPAQAVNKQVLTEKTVTNIENPVMNNATIPPKQQSANVVNRNTSHQQINNSNINDNNLNNDRKLQNSQPSKASIKDDSKKKSVVVKNLRDCMISVFKISEIKKVIDGLSDSMMTYYNYLETGNRLDKSQPFNLHALNYAESLGAKRELPAQFLENIMGTSLTQTNLIKKNKDELVNVIRLYKNDVQKERVMNLLKNKAERDPETVKNITDTMERIFKAYGRFCYLLRAHMLGMNGITPVYSIYYIPKAIGNESEYSKYGFLFM